MADDWLDQDEQGRGPQHHGPARVDGDGQGQRECRSDERADIGNETQHPCKDTPQDRAGDADGPKSEADRDSETGVDRKLDQEEAAQSPGCIVQRRRRALQVMRACQPDQPVPQVFPLQQNEDHENDDDERRRERVDQR